MPELIRRVLEAGLEKLGQENLRNLMGEMRLPKEILAILFAQIDETKTGLYRVFAREIRDFLECDTIGYLSLEGLLTAVGRERTSYCSSCYTGVYPVEFPRDEATYLQLALKLDNKEAVAK